MLEMALHAADISNAAKATPLYLRWVSRIMEEFFQQVGAGRVRLVKRCRSACALNRPHRGKAFRAVIVLSDGRLGKNTGNYD